MDCGYDVGAVLGIGDAEANGEEKVPDGPVEVMPSGAMQVGSAIVSVMVVVLEGEAIGGSHSDDALAGSEDPGSLACSLGRGAGIADVHGRRGPVLEQGPRWGSWVDIG